MQTSVLNSFSTFSTPRADVPSNLSSVIFVHDKSRQQTWVAPSSHVLCGLRASRTPCISGEQMDRRSQDAKRVAAVPWSPSPCLQASPLPHQWVRVALGSLSHAQLDFEGWAAEMMHESSCSSHNRPQRAIFHDHISQHNHTLLIAKQKWNIWEFALSVQNSSPDKKAVAAFEMLTSSRLTVVSDSPSPAQAKWELVAVAEISFELEQWKFLCS